MPLLGAMNNPDTKRKIEELIKRSDLLLQNEAEIFRDLEMMNEDQERHIIFADWVLAALEIRDLFKTLFKGEN